MQSKIIVCPSCGQLNRAPAERLARREIPQCGGCHAPLFDGHPAEIADEAAFERLVGRTEIPVLVDFWAGWCGPCRAMAPHFAAAGKALQPFVRFAKLDTEAVPGVAARLGIRSIPTIILFQGGREIARQAGALDERGLLAWLQRVGAT